MSCVTEEAYLGVLISHDLSWGPHISNVATAANQKLGYIKRNLKGCPKELKKLAYLSLVRSKMEAAAIIWDPQQGNHKYQLERVQRRAARWIQSDYGRESSVTQKLKTLKLDTQEEGRRIGRLTFLWKVMNDKVAVPRDELNSVKSTKPIRGLIT